jgi:hypothetical protein
MENLQNADNCQKSSLQAQAVVKKVFSHVQPKIDEFFYQAQIPELKSNLNDLG